MRVRNTRHGFGLVTKLLHWTTALVMIGLIALGWYMVELSYYDPWYHKSLLWHKALGMLVFVCGVATLVWHRISPLPAPLASLKPWERIAATAMHHTLLLMVVLLPLTGYLIATSAGKALEIFDWFNVPAVIAVDDDLRDTAIALHYYLAYASAGLALLHAIAAFKHQLVDRDGTLARMLWR